MAVIKAGISSKVATYSILVLFALFAFFPFYWMVLTSLKDPKVVYKAEIDLLPRRLSLEVYRKILSDPLFRMDRYVYNSLIISLGSTVVCVLTAIFGGYALSRRRVPGKTLFFYMIVATLMVPVEVVIVGIFSVANFLNMVNTYQGLILPLSVNAVIFYLLYNFMLKLPKDLEDAATIDGASQLQVVWHVVIPFSWPAILSSILLTFLNSWQAFTIPYILATSDKMYPLAVGILFQENTLFASMQEILVVSTILTIPTILVCLATQKFVFEGITSGALKY